MSGPAPGAPQRPHCVDCGRSDCRVVGVVALTAQGKRVSHLWLCASCEYLREHPDAPRAALPPRERRPTRLQSETLF